MDYGPASGVFREATSLASACAVQRSLQTRWGIPAYAVAVSTPVSISALTSSGGGRRARLDAAQDESPQICRRCQARPKTPKSLPCTTTAETRLTSAMRCAIVEGMNRARLLRLLLGGGLTVPSLASGRQAFVPLDKPAGGGRSYHCRGGSGRHVGSLLGGVFKPSRLAGGCHWLPALSGARAGSHFSGFEISPGVLRERASSQHLAPRGEGCRSVSASILSISAETDGRAWLPVPALNSKEILL